MSTHPEPAEQAAPAPKRMSLSQVVEALLNRGGSEHSSVTISRNAKGETQLEVVVRTGETGNVQTIEEAEEAATAVYDRLREQYPYGTANGGESSSS
jgi:hypothetical protein